MGRESFTQLHKFRWGPTLRLAVAISSEQRRNSQCEVGANPPQSHIELRLSIVFFG